MSRSKNSRKGSGKAPGKELWSRRPLSGYAHNGENKRLSRRIERKRQKATAARADDRPFTHGDFWCECCGNMHCNEACCVDVDWGEDRAPPPIDWDHEDAMARLRGEQPGRFGVDRKAWL